MYWQGLWCPAVDLSTRGTFLIGQEIVQMALAKINNHMMAAQKAERERDKSQAMRDYQAEINARQANMARLRALRLAKESADAQSTIVVRPVKKKVVNRRSIVTQGRVRKQALS